MRAAAEAMEKPFVLHHEKDGVFSLWNGQSPVNSRPRRTSLTPRRLTNSDSGMRPRSSSRKAGLNPISVGEIVWVRSTHQRDNSKAEAVGELALTTTEFGRARVDGFHRLLPPTT